MARLHHKTLKARLIKGAPCPGHQWISGNIPFDGTGNSKGDVADQNNSNPVRHGSQPGGDRQYLEFTVVCGKISEKQSPCRGYVVLLVVLSFGRTTVC